MPESRPPHEDRVRPETMSRAEFLRSLAAATVGLLIPGGCASAPSTRDPLGGLLPLRRLGKTGRSVTMLGVGGAHVGGNTVKTDAEAQQIVEVAIEGGVRFFETGEYYGKGEHEKRYGRVLTPRYRDHIFLATKTMARDAATAREHLEGSLRRMKTDVLDLWQMHCLVTEERVDERLAGGVLDVMLKAREDGLVRHIGFTGHHNPAAHLHLLKATDVMETTQMPINIVDPGFRSFIRLVLPEVVARGMGVQAMKSLAGGKFIRPRADAPGEGGLLIPGRVSLREAVHFVWSLPVSVLVMGSDNVAQMREQIELARAFAPLDAAAREALVERVADMAGRKVEGYKRPM